jgi:peptidoglycan/xylan/chitin deacetylase (PgdA/CDA1 family)
LFDDFLNVEIPILTYHSIDATAPETFWRQMRFLKENDYKVVSLQNLAENLGSENELPPKTIALTFDDGFRNFYSAAFPILAANGFTATVFLVTDFCGKYNDWAGNPPRLPRSALLSWRQIKEMRDYGRIEFGAHTRTHPDLTELPPDEAEKEIVESKKIIEDAIGGEVKTFAYPFGKFDASVKATVEKNFRAACSVKLGKARRTSDLFALERIDCYYLKNPKMFASLSAKPFDYYLKFRQSLRAAKSLVYG